MNLRNLTLLCLFTVAPASAGAASSSQALQPNIVHIFADDLGWGSVGFNGQQMIQTPHLDGLAAGGLVFNNAYAATVCGPTRAMLYSGFHNGHTLVDRNQNLSGDVFRDDGQTVGDHLQAAGYNTAVFGKWGFGGSNTGGSDLRPNPGISGANSLPNQQGFQTFYGYLNHGRAHSYRVDSLWTTEQPFADNNNGIDEVGEAYASQPGVANGLWLEKTGNNSSDLDANYTADLVRQKSLDYIEDSAASGQPFYLQHASTIPHFDIDAVRNQPGWFDDYGDAKVPGSDSWTDDQKAYAAMITRFDESVGLILDKLRDPNGDGDLADSIIENTLVIFTSDNGATQEDNSDINFFNANGGKRGGKRDLWDGGINVPMVAYWEGTIAGGQTSDVYTDVADFLPTAVELAGGESRVGVDGVSLTHELIGAGVDRHRDYLIFEHHAGDGPDPDSRSPRWAIVRGDHKLIRFSNGDLDLYHLENDPGETSPLSFGDTGNAAVRDELRAIALAEGVEQGDNYTVEFQDWVGGGSDNFNDASNWSGTATGSTPSGRWSAVINNASGSGRVASADVNTSLLGLEVRGEGARQTVRANRETTLTARNEIRVSSGGRIQLDDATLSTVRWVDVKVGGELTGHGAVVGDLYNWGAISPGLPDDLPQPSDPPPPPVIPVGVDTGVVSALEFDFSAGDGQDEAPLTATSTLDQYLEVVGGLDFGPGVSPRDAANVGNEFNVAGFQSGGAFASAVGAADYLTYTIDPVFGIEMLVDQVFFRYWRNGANAARQYAIATSLGGFAADAELIATSPTYASSDTNTYFLSGQYLGGEWTQEPVEVRLYGWNANAESGNTHVIAAGLTASFRTIAAEQAVVFNFAAQGDGQNESPLTATSVASGSVQIVSGLDLGPGLLFKPPSFGTNNGNEFDVEGFSLGTTLSDAIAEQDYLTYTVQAIAGVEMDVREVSFELWRNGSNAPDSFAIMTSLTGFSVGDELGILGPVAKNDGSAADPSDLIGFDSRTTFSADTGGGVWTSDPVEVRLYGWGAGNAAGNAHITGAELTALFRTVGGPDVALDPTGVLTLDGDLFHIDGGMIAIDLGGVDQSDPLDPEYDQLKVSGAVELAGDLTVSLVDGFNPAYGDTFTILTSGALEGAFDLVLADALTPELQWSLSYLTTGIELTVIAAGDFNRDGVVDGADYSTWRNNLGEQTAAYTKADADGNGLVDQDDYLIWRGNFGFTGAISSAVTTVPEPASVLLLTVTLAAGSARKRKLYDRQV